jgi:hypothetical protein
MSRITTIAELINNIDTAAKISKLLYEKNLMLDAVELKTKFTELFGILADMKLELSELQDLIRAKDKDIAELEQALKFKDKLVCIRDAYYMIDSKGKPTGDGHCVKCWENNHKKRKLVVKTDDADVKICPTCGQTYSRVETENIKKKFSFFNQ